LHLACSCNVKFLGKCQELINNKDEINKWLIEHMLDITYVLSIKC